MNMTKNSLPLVLALVLGTATITGAWFFQLVIGLDPCPMCLTQRWPYYIGLPILALSLVLIKTGNRKIALTCVAITAALFFAGALYGGYHSGVEWRLWQGPAACTGGQELSFNVENLLQDLKTVKVVDCREAAWRFLGLSLAGYNVIISTIIVALCVLGIARIKKT
jgi:disulfide bond formation protein DsbB